ncbi:hypothetical protein OSTOST_03632 [Ostertagia ostertagi]
MHSKPYRNRVAVPRIYAMMEYVMIAAIRYRNCGPLEPFVLAVGVVGSLITDDLPNPLELRRAFWTRYGSLRFRCNSTVPFPKDGLPSVLNLFELNVAGNVMFRICACLPVAVSFSLCTAEGGELIRADFVSSSVVHNLMNEAAFAWSWWNFLRWRYLALLLFERTLLSNRNVQRLDSISMVMKALSTMAFCYVSPQYFQRHHANISFKCVIHTVSYLKTKKTYLNAGRSHTIPRLLLLQCEK